MKEALALLILLACACSSFADPLPASLMTKSAASTFLLDQPDQYCTASAISRDGYMITALHCVRDCLIAAGAGESGQLPFVSFDLFVSKRARATNVVCKNVAIPTLGVTQVTVVETGTGVSQFDSHFMTTYPDAMADLKAHGYITRSNDYAILKITPPHPLACWPVATTTAASGSMIWAIGFPRPADLRVQKPLLTPSSGRVYASAQDSRAYQASSSTNEQLCFSLLYSDSAILYSSAATDFGQSGGPVIDVNGSLVGVVSGFTNLKIDAKTEIHELVAVASPSILKNVSPALRATLLSASAQCR